MPYLLIIFLLFFFFFFFQAEDGIRDGHVTGVQTCALPIYRRLRDRGGDRTRRDLLDPDALYGHTIPASRLPGGRRRGTCVHRRHIDRQRLAGYSRFDVRSEERRVGKECRYWWSRCE